MVEIKDVKDKLLTHQQFYHYRQDTDDSDRNIIKVNTGYCPIEYKKLFSSEKRGDCYKFTQVTWTQYVNHLREDDGDIYVCDGGTTIYLYFDRGEENILPTLVDRLFNGNLTEAVNCEPFSPEAMYKLLQREPELLLNFFIMEEVSDEFDALPAEGLEDDDEIFVMFNSLSYENYEYPQWADEDELKGYNQELENDWRVYIMKH